MKVNFNDSTPIFRQIADAIEDDILSGKLKEGERYVLCGFGAGLTYAGTYMRWPFL